MPTKNPKSALTTYQPGEMIFSVKDTAKSLFIIQKGQIRLFIPKGKGYVDLAVLRPGEVIGEMAYFYGEKAKMRSCSAAAVNTVELIEIPFEKFEKTIESLNPWFKVIVNTLADRVRSSNEKIRELESDSVGYSGGRKGDYTFFQNIDIVRGLAYLYMIFKAQADVSGKTYKLAKDKLKIFMVDIFGYKETKLEEFIYLLEAEGFITLEEGEDGRKNIICINDLDLYRTLFMFFNSQRLTEEDKKMTVSFKCEEFLSRIKDKVKDATPDEKGFVFVKLTPILEDFKKDKLQIDMDDFEQAIKHKIAEDPMSDPDGGGLGANVNLKRLMSLWPNIQLTNAVTRFNDSKKKKGRY